MDNRSARENSAIRNYPLLVKRYARLLEVTSELVSMLDVDKLLQHIVDAAEELTDSEATSLLLYDVQSEHLYFAAATNELSDGIGRQAVPADSSIAGWVFTHGEPLLVADALNDPRFFREVDVLTRFRTRSVLGVPLQTKGKTIGVIEAINKKRVEFDEHDVRLLQALGAVAAIAIENSRLFLQSDVVSEMVHELRTPLSSLMAAAYLLQRSDLPTEQYSRLGHSIYSEVKRLNDMTTDFLDLARLESGRSRFTLEPVHLGGLVGECLEIVRPQADADQISLEADIDRTVEPVQGDRARLKQLVLNLLTNAIKYNHPGGRVVVRVGRDDQGLVLSVSDTGKGIPAESLPRVFERFYRVPDLEGKIEGTGLGLAIARHIAESNEGSIRVESEVGKGSTFTVHLPSTEEGPRGTG